MADDGVDISSHSSNNVDEYMDIPFDYIIRVCDNAKENCRIFHQKRNVSIKTFLTQPKLPEQNRR